MPEPTVPMFPLGSVLLPGERIPLRIFEPRYREMLSDCLSHGPDPSFGIVLIARGSEVGGGEDRHDVGTLARIEDLDLRPDGRASFTAVGGSRFRVAEWLPDDPYPRARIEVLGSPAPSSVHRDAIGELSVRVRDALEVLADTRGIPRDRLPVFGDPTADDALLDAHGIGGWAARVPIGPADRQRLLEAGDADSQIEVLTDAVDGFAAIVEFGG